MERPSRTEGTHEGAFPGGAARSPRQSGEEAFALRRGREPPPRPFGAAFRRPAGQERLRAGPAGEARVPLPGDLHPRRQRLGDDGRRSRRPGLRKRSSVVDLEGGPRFPDDGEPLRAVLRGRGRGGSPGTPRTGRRPAPGRSVPPSRRGLSPPSRRGPIGTQAFPRAGAKAPCSIAGATRDSIRSDSAGAASGSPQPKTEARTCPETTEDTVRGPTPADSSRPGQPPGVAPSRSRGLAANIAGRPPPGRRTGAPGAPRWPPPAPPCRAPGDPPAGGTPKWTCLPMKPGSGVLPAASGTSRRRQQRRRRPGGGEIARRTGSSN